jgi:hypothetical protein
LNVSKDELKTAKMKLILLLHRLLQLEQRQRFSGRIFEDECYEHHGRQIALNGSTHVTDYLQVTMDRLPEDDVPAFIRVIESISIFLPPLYVGITLAQTLQSRYEQHKRDYSSGSSDTTFGGRVSASGLAWNDLVLSVAPQPALRLSDISIEILEDYLQYFSRPKLGKA